MRNGVLHGYHLKRHLMVPAFATASISRLIMDLSDCPLLLPSVKVPLEVSGLAFEMEQNVGLIILEHLCHKLNVHVLNVDFL